VVLHGEGSPLRLGPWQGDPGVAYVVPVHGGSPSAVTDVRRALALAGEQGYRSVVTAALAPLDQAAFLTVGFEVHERLHLLARSLPAAHPPAPTLPAAVMLRRGHQHDRDGVLRLDHQAFESFWRLDQRGLADAIAATPSARFRVAVTNRGATPEVLGYAVIGRAAQRGYVQRLAVAPDRHRRGVGRSLLIDGLRWLQRRRVRRVMVNTQERNVAALALYERAGFERQPGGLAVLSLSLGDAT
jgi:ribosomal protein S18 acetylase RimI-like enzyme